MLSPVSRSSVERYPPSEEDDILSASCETVFIKSRVKPRPLGMGREGALSHLTGRVSYEILRT
jgi:hypothetical protein